MNGLSLYEIQKLDPLSLKNLIELASEILAIALSWCRSI